MTSPPRTPASSGDDTPLLGLARQLRDAAVAAGRPDVAAKAEDAIALLTGTDEPTTDGGNTVIRIMNGLGF